jgi:hypothetical protein
MTDMTAPNELLRDHPVRRRARSIPPKSLKDCYWWLKQIFLAVRDPDLREWVLRKWGYKPYQTVDRRKRPLRIKMQFISQVIATLGKPERIVRCTTADGSEARFTGTTP